MPKLVAFVLGSVVSLLPPCTRSTLAAEGDAPSLPAIEKSFDDTKAQAREASVVTTLIKTLAACRDIRLAADRLKCYDDFSEKVENKANSPLWAAEPQNSGAKPKNGEAASDIVGNWHLQKSPDGTVAAGLIPIFSEGDGPEWRHIHWALFIRCRAGGQKDIYLESEKKIFDSAVPVDVTLRTDNGKDISQPWEASVGGSALGLWGNERSSSVFKEILQQRRLSVHVLLPNAGSLFLSFDLLGIENAMIPIENKCHG
jgi:hypothetical protein